MTRIRVACQTYTWEMLGAEWTGRVDDLLYWISDAGYAGIEITNHMIREYADRPDEFASALERCHLQLAAFAYSSPSGFTDAGARHSDLASAVQVIDFLSHFAEPRLGLGGAASPTRGDAGAELDRAIGFYNEVGRLASARGISVNVHPHSHFGSLLESSAEYQYLVDHLDPSCVSFGPDTGHIVRGGQDLLACLRTYASRITHLHLKDVSREHTWVSLGKGICDFPAVLSMLESIGYSGWIVAEEESEEAGQDGIAAIRRNRAYLRSIGY